MVPKIRIDPTACFMGAAMLLILPLRWLLAAFLAAAVHELCHIGAILLTRGQVRSIRIGGSGAILETAPMTPGRELVCAMAGPVGGLSMLLFIRWIPCTAICALVQSAYNLLPFLPMDGGRILHCGLEILLGSDRSDRISKKIGFLAASGMFLLGAYGFIFLKWGIFALILLFSALAPAATRKIPCKKARFGLQ